MQSLSDLQLNVSCSTFVFVCWLAYRMLCLLDELALVAAGFAAVSLGVCEPALAKEAASHACAERNFIAHDHDAVEPAIVIVVQCCLFRSCSVHSVLRHVALAIAPRTERTAVAADGTVANGILQGQGL
jgi:hypothetical protein